MFEVVLHTEPGFDLIGARTQNSVSAGGTGCRTADPGAGGGLPHQAITADFPPRPFHWLIFFQSPAFVIAG